MRDEESIVPRVTTGIRGLDTVLHGGLLPGRLYLALGGPGAGKTVLANQVAFHRAAQGESVLYVTLLAESHGRMLANLERMTFYRPEVVSRGLVYVSGMDVTAEHGLGGLVELLTTELVGRRVRFLVVDGFPTAEALAESPVALKRFLHQVQQLLASAGCTGLLLGDGCGNTATRTMVDGVVALRDELAGVRAVRSLAIRKMRGSTHLRGRHVMTIDARGVTVFPRLEALVAQDAPTPPDDRALLSTGIAGLDAMLGGGLVRGSTALVVGPPGAGKTTIALHVAGAALRHGLRVVYLGFNEAPSRLLGHGETLGIDLRPAAAAGQLRLGWRPPLEHLLDDVGHGILDTVGDDPGWFVILDGVGGLRQGAAHPERLTPFLTALTAILRGRDVTALFTEEGDVAALTGLPEAAAEISATMETVVALREDDVARGRRGRLVRVHKHRHRRHDLVAHPFDMGPTGIVVR